MAAASVHVMSLGCEQYKQVTEPMLSHINVGTGVDVTIRELAETVGKVVGFGGELVFDSAKPDGAPRKLMNTEKLNQLGWSPEYDLEAGLTNAYQWFLANQGLFRA